MVRDLPQVMTHCLARLKIFIFFSSVRVFQDIPFFEKKVVIFILDLFSIEVFLPPLFQVFPVEV